MSNASFKDIKISSFPEGLYIRGKSYRYRRNYNGKRILQIWGDIPYDEAQLRAKRLNLSLEEGISITEVASKTTFQDFAIDVWLKKKSSEIRAASLSRYRAVAENFMTYLKEKKLDGAGIETITYQLASDYLVHRSHSPIMPNGHKKFTRHLKAGASKSTLHFERNALCSMFREAVKRNLTRQNPFQDVKSKKPSRQEVATAHHPLTEAEEVALLQAAKAFDGQTKETGNPSYFDLFFFLVKTGLRENELRNLEWTDIDWHNDVIRIGTKKVFETRTISIPSFAVDGLRRRVRDKQPHDSVFVDSKDVRSFGFRLAIRTMPELLALKVQDVDIRNRVIKMTREYTWLPKATNGKVPMCEGVRTLLRRLEENHTSNFVFAHHDGGACRVDIWDALKTVQKMAGIQGRLRVHDLRHTLAIRLREKGVSLETIMGILRHANIEETLIYAPYQIEEGQNAMRLLDSPSPKSV
jgi:integrase